MKKQVFFIFLFLLCVLFGASCTRDKNPSGPITEEPEQGKYIRGTVVLENQTNHASCIVFVDSLFIGTATDSSGYFEIPIPDSLSHVSGTFDIYCYIYSFKPEKATFKMDSGSVVPGFYDADSSGTLRPVFLNQLVRMTVTTDKNTYSLSGDTILMCVEIINTWKNPIGYFLWEQVAAGNCWFYNLNDGNLVQYLLEPAGVGTYYVIEPGESSSEEAALSLPFKHNAYSNEVFPPGEYLFMPRFFLLWFYGINENDMANKLESFLKHQDCSWLGEGFVTSSAKSKTINALDTKDLYFPKISITP